MIPATLLERIKNSSVEWKALGEISELIRGHGLPKNVFSESGIPAIHYGQIYTYYGLSTEKTISFVTHETALKLRKVNYGDVIITNTSENLEDVGKSLVYLGKEQAVTGGHATILKPKQSILGKYFAYWTQINDFYKKKIKFTKGTKVIDLSTGDLAKIIIPLPPLDIQNEIVHILDTFTELTTELTAERNARQKQYQYYRDLLLSEQELAKIGFEWKTLGEIAKNLDSMRQPITNGLRKAGEIPYCGASGVIDYVDNYIFDGDYLLISEDGANLVVRKTPIAFSISGKSWVNNHVHVLEFETYAERRFVEIYLNSIDLAPYISGAAQPKLNQQNLNSIKIPLPSLSEQARIVAILDQFDTLTHSITEGLPREIKLRQQQYEYYRDVLLSFPTPT
ncbi:restriction endonuclease subunit S [Candidatus Nitrosacidococcus sp. I8]|uniref:restriction endonuclease subunit S n=1 Tax=Candidatus Nitrosacidococcus sp. I8 TaxID=2942908 RepID=UPI0022273E3D|nr:restriction endonuclease subunit S [Candidatus Nitrosacidococcus sp. I8]CAH9017006.1 hypothetical protein NURINAE_00278 [Candidatus Nitrosacidococcus sp. I8]